MQSSLKSDKVNHMLTHLLEKNRKFSPVFTHPKGKLTNHLSMVLVALKNLGASEERMNNYFINYAVRLENIPQAMGNVKIEENNWRNYLGKKSFFTNYFLFFQYRIQAVGIENILSASIEVLLEGIGELHGLIRLAYAIESNDNMEVAFALAYAASYFYAYGTAQSSSAKFKTINAAFHYMQQFSLQPIVGNNIHERLENLIKQPNFTSFITAITFNENFVKDCAENLLRLYAITNDFVVLHALTVTHALRLIFPYIQKREQSLNYYWKLFSMIYLYVGAPVLPEEKHILSLFHPQLTWVEILVQAIEADDAHIIKLIYSCYAENNVYHDPLYQYVAEKALAGV